MFAAEAQRFLAERMGDASLDVTADGRRVVVDGHADRFIRPRRSWFDDRGIDIFRQDGTLCLDSDGKYRYRPAPGMEAYGVYERI